MPGKPCTTLTLWLTFIVLLASPVASYDQNLNDLERQVFLALNRVLNFYHREFKSVNLDGIFGLRVAQGAFLSVLNDVQAGQLKLDEHLLGQVRDLYNKASLIGQRALPFLKQSTPDYFKKFRKQVSNPWANFKPFTNKELLKRNYNPQKRRNIISFDEETSDQCMSALTGTGSNSHITQPCQVSDKCWGVISAEGAEGYALTHQALFFLLGETQGCTPQLLKRLEQSHIKGGLEQIYNRICSDMYPQMIALERKGGSKQLDSYDRDLYMEQAMVCGSIGYHDFLSSERLRNILTWQRKDGCFGEKNQVSKEDDKQDYYIDDGKAVGIGMKVRAPFDDIKQSLEDEYSKILRKPLSVSMRTMRSLLVEKELNDGCLSHLTGVATGVLGVYLRWLLYPKAGQLFQNQEKVEVKTSEGLAHNTNIEIYKMGNLADVIVQKEKQLHHQQSIKKNSVMQTAHLRQMRRAAMLRNNAQVLLSREGSESFPWGMVTLGTCSIFLVLSVMWIKGFKGTLNVLKTASRTKKSTHVI